MNVTVPPPLLSSWTVTEPVIWTGVTCAVHVVVAAELEPDVPVVGDADGDGEADGAGVADGFADGLADAVGDAEGV